jgi:hypothetical protein
MKRRDRNPKPNLFIVGAPKCGTTALSEYLRSHPEIFVTKEKEVHYFCFDFDERYPRPYSMSEYINVFKNVRGESIIVDASPWYLYSKEAIEAAYHFNSEARFIAMIRSPFEMVPSLHRQLLNNKDEDERNLATAWRLQSQRRHGKNLPAYCRDINIIQYKNVCMLGRQIQKFFQVVPPEQRMVIVLDDLKRDAKSVYQKVLSFLELEDDGRNEFPVVNAAFHWRYRELSDFVLTPPKVVQTAGKAFLKLIGRDRIGLFQLLYHINNNLNRKRYLKISLPQELLTDFKSAFSHDIDLLCHLLNRELHGWLK